MADQNVKLINKNKHDVGIKLMDNIREINVRPDSFTYVSRDDVLYINSISRIFSKKHLIIDDDELNQILGYSEKGIESFSDKEIEDLLKGNVSKLKKQLEDVTEKHLIDKVIGIAKNMSELTTAKVKYLSEWSGYDLNQLITEDDK